MLFCLVNVFSAGTVFAYSAIKLKATPTGIPAPNAPTRPSSSCIQPDRYQNISTLTLKERLDQGYPLPVAGKTNSTIDKIIHDRGKHFCLDTDVPRKAQTSVNRVSESNDRIFSGNYGINENYTLVYSQWVESCISWGTNDHVVTWVGIGGIDNHNLVQTGSEEDNWSATDHQSYVWAENTASSY
jgi:hypothetical protein